ncbi:hypothetical protein [Paenibacillus terrae]|uniref:hypothetical protein n=1 Tax=Paenibacillus terrae TaxID=159743 RepID=UPI0011EB157C|nr:hypothetical protein [Paenibacillus terrae]
MSWLNQETAAEWRRAGKRYAAVTSNEGMLAVGTCGGMLHVIDLQSGTKDEYSIGTAPIHETERWIIWRNHEPLRW